MNPVRHILVIRGGALGDFLLTLPALAALLAHFPEAQIEILGYPRIASLAVAGGLASTVHALESPAFTAFFTPEDPLPAPGRDFFARFDLIISYVFDPEKIFQRRVQSCTSARFVAGGHRPEETQNIPAAEFFLRPLMELGITSAPVIPRLAVPPSASPRLSAPCLALHPGSGSPRKNWPEAAWAELLARLTWETNWNFLLIGGEAEAGKLARLAALLDARRTRVAENWPLPELAAALARANFFLGHDSGITHLAGALGVRGLVLWGETNAAIWQPPQENIRLLRTPQGLSGLSVETVRAALPLPSPSS